MHLKRIFTKRWVAIVVVCYLALWALTAFIGCPQARRRILRRHARIANTTRELARHAVYECCAPAYWCRTTCYAPFLVTTSYDFKAGRYADGYTSVFLWLGTLQKEIVVSHYIT